MTLVVSQQPMKYGSLITRPTTSASAPASVSTTVTIPLPPSRQQRQSVGILDVMMTLPPLSASATALNLVNRHLTYLTESDLLIAFTDDRRQRTRVVYLSQNDLGRVPQSLSGLVTFTSLHVLSLADNAIDNVAVLSPLTDCLTLRKLTLTSNPVTTCPYYRSRVLTTRQLSWRRTYVETEKTHAASPTPFLTFVSPMSVSTDPALLRIN